MWPNIYPVTTMTTSTVRITVRPAAAPEPPRSTNAIREGHDALTQNLAQDACMQELLKYSRIQVSDRHYHHKHAQFFTETAQRLAKAYHLEQFGLRRDPDLRLAFCALHSTALSLSTLQRHLKSVHKVNGHKHQGLRNWCESLGLHDDVTGCEIRDNGEPIADLPVLNAWSCTVPDCRFITTSDQRRETHYRNQHGKMVAQPSRQE